MGWLGMTVSPYAQAAPPIPAPQNVPYPGTITLSVDATDLPHQIFRAHETIPVAKAGPMVLLYPQWLPGNHSPTGQIEKLSGLIVTANGKRLSWSRDPVDMYAFHIEVPEGAHAITVDLQFDSPIAADQGRVLMTPAMLSLQWEKQLVYPAGYYAGAITVTPSVKLPAGWGFGTALETQSTSGAITQFKSVPLDVLVDSPMIAGKNFARVETGAIGGAPVFLDITADRPDQLVASPDALKTYRSLVEQAGKLFGSHHFDHYDFLLSLSESLGGEGLEHHRSSEDSTKSRYFLDWKNDGGSTLLPHEFTHSWNGKFRRPADLWTPNYNVPMQNSLLWVYEGQTQYWGNVLSARAGEMNRAKALDLWAYKAAVIDHQTGRSWRDLEDTTNTAIIGRRKSGPWPNWERGTDYYDEGSLVWLDADTLIRQLSDGKKSLDDFAQLFFGVKDGNWAEETYSFDDVVAALNAVQPYDWAKFLRTRLDSNADGAPLDGLARGGYKLVYTDKPNEYLKQIAKAAEGANFAFSLGFSVSTTGELKSVLYGSPAFAAGLSLGAKIVAVNGEAFGTQSLEDALKWAKEKKTPIALLIEKQKSYRTVEIPYYEGPRYPHLEPIGDGAKSLDAILTAK